MLDLQAWDAGPQETFDLACTGESQLELKTQTKMQMLTSSVNFLQVLFGVAVCLLVRRLSGRVPCVSCRLILG